MASSSASTALVPLRASELIVGQRSPWPIYNEAGDLLLARGSMVETQGQLDGLLEHGLFRNEKWGTEPDTDSVPLPQSRDVLQKRRRSKGLRPPAPSRGQESIVTMDEVRWRIGDALSLQLKEAPDVRYNISLMGSLAGKSVLVSAPVKDGKYMHLRDGQIVVVRALSGRRAYAFVASVLKYQNLPYPYLHLSCPREVRCTVIRQDTRVEVDVDAFLTIASAPPAALNLLDLSVGGVSGVSSFLGCAKDATGRLKFIINVAGEERGLDLDVVLRTVEADSDPNYAKYGLEFVDVSARDRLILSAFVYQTVSETD
ncbi:flagellar brake protein [Herbaspirillum rhizosphaerae]|uniref:flagellar brake protein n=1 Tax=Herbaspirillum rhizosphaerae TaxID=346179 RepID=UPI00067B7039|nr:flagellar brake protein [Herbaspirillum rhizosphaerae]